MLIGRLCHASTDFTTRGLGSNVVLVSEVLLMEAKAQLFHNFGA